jgi:hypothetical protein
MAATFFSSISIAHAACQPSASEAVLCATGQVLSHQNLAQDTTEDDIGFNPPNLCKSPNPINPDPENGPTGPLGKALSGLEYNNQSDGSDVYCKTDPPKNPYYQDQDDHNYQTGQDDPASFTIAGPLTQANFDQYCQETLGANGDPTGGGVQRDGDNGYSWQCHRQPGDQGIPIEMNDVCQQQFGSEATRSRLNYYWSGNPQMWECLSNAKRLGGLDLNAYCSDVVDDNGDQPFSGEATDGNSAYDIFCQADDSDSNQSGTDGNSVKFDTMLDACQWQFPQNQFVIDVLINYSDPTSWECWGPQG